MTTTTNTKRTYEIKNRNTEAVENLTMPRYTTYTVYHRSAAGDPGAHNSTRGDWYFEPSDWDGGDVYSEGYPTQRAAEEAAREWEDKQAIETRAEKEEA